MQVRVTQIDQLTPSVKQFVLSPVAGATLPAFTAGAHIQVLTGTTAEDSAYRHYSLIVTQAEATLFTQPDCYVIAVLVDDSGRGGSRYMHEQVALDDVLTIRPPENNFALVADTNPAYLIAGGIGITPLISMVSARRLADLPVQLVYAGRSASLLAYTPQLTALLAPAHFHPHYDDVAGGPPDIAPLLREIPRDGHLYVCGPSTMIEQVLVASQNLSWSQKQVHYELFNTTPLSDDQPFSVVLAQSGVTIDVGGQQSILEALIAAGFDPLYDCQRGACGLCMAVVLEGDVIHRDTALTEEERQLERKMQMCVSRAKGSRLVIDL